MGKLSGKVAVVTGAASGIGRASALLFAREGAAVVIADCDRSGSDATADAIHAAGGTGLALHVDVTQSTSVEAMIDAAVARFGRLDVLFNNAGIGGTYAPLTECSDDNFDRVIAVNLKGVFLGMKYGIPAILRSGGGSVINTASIAGLVGVRGFPAYSASKGGVIQLTKVAALEHAARNVRVNCICPGGVDTPILEMVPVAQRDSAARANPMTRLGRPDEIANMALFLASDDSSFATGGVFVVDGGSVAQ